MKTEYIVYDGRANTMGTDEAQVMFCAHSLQEARREARSFGECAIYEYDVDESKNPPELINERYIGPAGTYPR